MKRLPWLHMLLFMLTCITTLAAGALQRGIDIISYPERILAGFPFATTLLTILLCHEFAHFFAARRHGVLATLPYFIPMPSFVGTMGAVIKMRSPIETREALVDIGSSGPLAGFVISLVACCIGLALSSIAPLTIPHAGTPVFGDSLLFSFLTWAILGVTPDAADIMLHPIAAAGWIGLFVTSLNLLPVGQLDGGHIINGLFGRLHRVISIGTTTILVMIGIFYWSGWLVLAGVMVVMGVMHPPVIHDQQQLDPRRRIIGCICIGIAFLTFTPVPFDIV